MGIYDYFHSSGENLMLASDYPYTSGNGDVTGNCLYSHSKATDVSLKGFRIYTDGRDYGVKAM